MCESTGGKPVVKRKDAIAAGEVGPAGHEWVAPPADLDFLRRVRVRAYLSGPERL